MSPRRVSILVAFGFLAGLVLAAGLDGAGWAPTGAVLCVLGSLAALSWGGR